MSGGQMSTQQPDSFEFSKSNMAWALEQIKKYPEGRQASATIPLLWRAQEQQGGWLPEPAINYVADLLDMAPIRVMEVATFYTMFAMQPVGKYFVQLCGTTPCLLRGSDELVDVLKKRIGGQNHVTKNGLFSWLEVECLGACSNAPMVQINQDYFEDLDAEKFEKLLDDLEAGRDVVPGPQNGRSCSCPQGGATTLTHGSLYTSPDDIVAAPVMAMSAAAMANEANREFSEIPQGTELQLEVATADLPVIEEDQAEITDEAKPQGLDKPVGGKADDLKKISGVGPKLEETLNKLGIFHFDQIAVWDRQNIAWVDNFLSFKGRIDREDWIEQARLLATAQEITDQPDDKKGDA